MNITLTNYNSDLPIVIEYKSLTRSHLGFDIPFLLEGNVLSIDENGFGLEFEYELYVVVKQNEVVIYDQRHIVG